MKRKIALTTISLLIAASLLNAQIIKVENGIALTSLKGSPIDVLNNTLATYTFALGIDYVSDKIWSLSSGISYMGIGGNENLPVENGSGEFANKIITKAKQDYLLLNTTFRIKTSKNYRAVYFGVGPSLGISLGDNKFNNTYFSDYTANNLLYGVKGETGINSTFKNILCGINLAYIHTFNDFSQNAHNKFRCSIFTASLTLAYDF
jgi:hypothetical protein